MLDHVDLWGVDSALLYIAEDTIQVNSELPAALGPWRKGHSKAVTALSLDALGRRASKVCHVIFADVIGWPGTAKLMEHQWTCHRGPLRTGPMRPKIHGYPMQSRLL